MIQYGAILSKKLSQCNKNRCDIIDYSEQCSSPKIEFYWKPSVKYCLRISTKLFYVAQHKEAIIYIFSFYFLEYKESIGFKNQ